MREQLTSILQEGIRQKIFYGAAAAWLWDGESVCTSVGTTFEEGGTAIRTDHLFDVASVTKSVPTAILANIAIERGLIDLQAPVCDAIPELDTNFATEIRWVHLLTHTLDYRLSLSSLKNNSPEEIWKKLMKFPFQKRPGENYLYCNSTSLVLGKAIERVFGQGLAELTQSEICTPLGLKRTLFKPLDRFRREEIVPTEKDAWRSRVVRGEVHDESAFAMKYPVGSAGLFSTVEDLALLLKELFACLDGNGKLLSAEGCKNMFANWTPHLEIEAALGWERNRAHFMGIGKLQNVVGKTGFTGSHLILDLDAKKAGVLLSNYTWPKRKENSNAMNAYRSTFNEKLWNLHD